MPAYFYLPDGATTWASDFRNCGLVARKSVGPRCDVVVDTGKDASIRVRAGVCGVPVWSSMKFLAFIEYEKQRRKCGGSERQALDTARKRSIAAAAAASSMRNKRSTTARAGTRPTPSVDIHAHALLPDVVYNVPAVFQQPLPVALNHDEGITNEAHVASLAIMLLDAVTQVAKEWTSIRVEVAVWHTPDMRLAGRRFPEVWSSECRVLEHARWLLCWHTHCAA